MPQIILSIEDPSDKIYQTETITCYIVDSKLPTSVVSAVIATGKMVLAQGEKALELCKSCNLDGVVYQPDTSKPLKSQLKPLRAALKNKTFGVIIPAHRHESMLAGEIEPEFIAFYPTSPTTDKEVISWYNELFLIPLAWICSDNPSNTNFENVDFAIVKAKNFENFGC